MSKTLARLLPVVSSLVLAVLMAEGLVRVLGLMELQQQAAISQEFEGEAEPDEGDDAEPSLSRWILHPYRGITPRPQTKAERTSGDRGFNVLGILSEVEDPRRLDPEDWVVGIFGGSVARAVALSGSEVLAEALEAAKPEGAGDLQVVNFAVSGTKQPQQLFLLQELVLLGVPIDVVVNLDGYNEVALAGTDAARGHHPLYPEWGFWTSALGSTTGSLSDRQLELAARVIERKRRARELVEGLRSSVFRHLRLARVWVGMQVLKTRAEGVRAEEELRRLPLRKASDDLFKLEDPCLGKEGGCWSMVARNWKIASQLMHATAAEAGATYYHFLQPNQYVAGTKPLSDEEREKAWDPERPWSVAAAAGYGHLIEAGASLESEGVHFVDLTLIFSDHPETLYVDACCHLNQKGTFMLATAIADDIVAASAAE